MKCMYCKKGDLMIETVTRSYEKDGVVIVITHVPVQLCNFCGQEYLDQDTVRRLENIRKNGRVPGLSMGVFEYISSSSGVIKKNNSCSEIIINNKYIGKCQDFY